MRIRTDRLRKKPWLEFLSDLKNVISPCGRGAPRNLEKRNKLLSCCKSSCRFGVCWNGQLSLMGNHLFKPICTHHFVVFSPLLDFVLRFLRPHSGRYYRVLEKDELTRFRMMTSASSNISQLSQPIANAFGLEPTIKLAGIAGHRWLR